uniref:CCHC-type domain-containing protein n=1 Tax=Lactuca sativa TaxID=4236 RepID=A0A9R1X1D8_LACSA|nr:hypothetical protein LSAT_V11C700367670 [Lactuca sativa]
MTVREYTTKFMEKARVERYIWGLRTAILEVVQIQKQAREREENSQGEDRALGKRKRDGQERKVYQGYEVKQCPKCNRYHKGECNMNQKVCYKCGKQGHIAPECKT